MKRRTTVYLPTDLVKKAKVLAAENDMSMSRLFEKLIRCCIEKEPIECLNCEQIKSKK